MKKVLLALCLLNVSLSVFGQILKGRILDAETQEAIPFASVFIDGTFAGTSSNELGHFELDVANYFSRPVTISAIGYTPFSLEYEEPAKIYRILLIRHLYEIEEVSVTGKGIAKKRKAYLRLFYSEFIGSTTNARRCYIMNEEDLTFNYDSDQDTLRAIALKPLVIHNNALGYHFIYHLETFEFEKRTQRVFYKGSIVFTHDLAWEGQRAKVYKRRRRYAYTGSNKEFFRKLWSKSLKSSGYSISNYFTGETLKYKDVITEDVQGRKYLKYSGDLEIHYYDYYSGIKFLSEKAFIDRDGFFDPVSISWRGRMSVQRIADFLPYEYSPGR